MWSRRGWMVVLCVLLQACAPWRTVQGPIVQVSDMQSCGAPARDLVVLLPGLYDRPEDFVKQGFVQAVRQRQLDADLLLLDAHVGYYNERQIVDRLRNEVVAPGVAKGYTRIWLVGISLGGLGSLLYAQAHPQDITGFFAMAPFLGDKPLLQAIDAAGGIAQWKPAPPERPGTEAWEMAQAYLRGADRLPQGYIGYGESDRFAPANAQFAAVLPAGHRFVASGGHDWRAWNALWSQFLDTGAIGRTARVPNPCTPKAP